jgi:hypothetical protein
MKHLERLGKITRNQPSIECGMISGGVLNYLNVRSEDSYKPPTYLFFKYLYVPKLPVSLALWL